jgi:hypothetical protein
MKDRETQKGTIGNVPLCNARLKSNRVMYVLFDIKMRITFELYPVALCLLQGQS